MDVRANYERFLRERHRPSHARRTAATRAAFFLARLRPGDRVLDLGCGPGSITIGLGEAVGDGVAVGIDLDPGPTATPLVRGDVHRLPFADSTFDAVFASALLQHVPEPLVVLVEAKRVCRPGAVIGVADADWGGALLVPDDPWLDRGQEILVALRVGTSPYVGRHLRQLLHDAGFTDCRAEARGGGGGDPVSTPTHAAFQGAMFEAPEVVAHVAAEGIATADEMAAVADAWRRWAAHPGSVMTGYWFEALASAPVD